MPTQQVQLSHVRRACVMFDKGALPRRRVQSLFITVSGKSYPAYFILTLAHRLTGRDKRKKWDESTTRAFFKTLGVRLRRTSAQYIRVSRSVFPSVPRKNGRPPRLPSERGRTIALYLKPADQAVCLRYGKTIQDGLQALILAAKE